MTKQQRIDEINAALNLLPKIRQRLNLGWCKGAYCCNEAGPIPFGDPGIKFYCLLGAIDISTNRAIPSVCNAKWVPGTGGLIIALMMADGAPIDVLFDDPVKMTSHVAWVNDKMPSLELLFKWIDRAEELLREWLVDLDTLDQGTVEPVRSVRTAKINRSMALAK